MQPPLTPRRLFRDRACVLDHRCTLPCAGARPRAHTQRRSQPCRVPFTHHAPRKRPRAMLRAHARCARYVALIHADKLGFAAARRAHGEAQFWGPTLHRAPRCGLTASRARRRRAASSANWFPCPKRVHAERRGVRRTVSSQSTSRLLQSRLRPFQPMFQRGRAAIRIPHKRP